MLKIMSGKPAEIEVEGGKFLVTPLPRNEGLEIISVLNFEKLNDEQALIPEIPKLAKLMPHIFEKCIAGWSDIEDDDGAIMEYNDENLQKFINYAPIAVASKVFAAIINYTIKGDPSGEEITSENSMQ